MTVTYREWKRDQLPLLLGFAGGTGSGKTFSALRVATGIAEATGTKVGAIDTENGRMLHYADAFPSVREYAELEAPFRPLAYAEAIEGMEKRGCGVIVVDSMSHEWAGDGGCLDWQEEEMRGEESRRMTAWIKPKRDHRKMVTRLLGVNAHVLLCFRAEEKVEMRKDANGRWEVVPRRSLTGLDGWIPVSERNLPFELTVSLLMTADAPGIPKPIKLEEQHRPMVPLDRPVDEAVGRALAAWAAGSSSAAAVAAVAVAADERSEDEVRAELEAVVQRLIATGAISFPMLWGNVAKQRGIDRDSMLELLSPGSTEFPWEPLRESLTVDEARTVLVRLEAVERGRSAA